jgi:putative ATP-dependent endonuclease of the OLD family
MYLAELRIENFRMFGENEDALVVPFRPQLTALVGENDSGKTAVVDALRFVLGTRDQEFVRVDDTDFHEPGDGTPRRSEIRVRVKFDALTSPDKAAFAEYLTYEADGVAGHSVLYVTWKATASSKPLGQRRVTSVEFRSGRQADGPPLDAEARLLLCATYLRPLRDADRALSAGRASRLSQILEHTKEVRDHGQDFDPTAGPPADLSTLSVLGIGDFANALLVEHQGLRNARTRLNTEYLKKLSFSGDQLQGSISVSTSKGNRDLRLRLLLEKLELELRDAGMSEPPPGRGLGSNNLLFVACELLLLGSEEEGFPMLLIEEPEAHLHPQRQLRLIEFLKDQVKAVRQDDQSIQVVLTSHSPHLASALDLSTLVLLHRGKAFSMAPDCTQLSPSDYGFLQRFLDVTKANMFFARGLLIVEGDAENILFPTLARLLGRDLTDNGVSIVNVGGVGLRRFARIFQRRRPDQDGTIEVPVACITDFDVMPDCAPVILGRVQETGTWPDTTRRRWRAERDFTAEDLAQRRADIRNRASGQCVETFVADRWTLEYDLAYSGLDQDVWIAAHLARADEAITAGKVTRVSVTDAAARSHAELSVDAPTREELASRVYALLESHSGVSKATAAQYLASLLEARRAKGELDAATLRSMLPSYVVGAIEYVTSVAEEEDTELAVAGVS